MEETPQEIRCMDDSATDPFSDRTEPGASLKDYRRTVKSPRRVFSGVAVVLIAIAVILSLQFWRKSPPTTNVLVITLDTTRADRLGCYGYAGAVTPALDRIAASGVRFESASSPAPLTLPSHASLFTGIYPPEHGLRTNGRGRLPESIPTLASLLAAAGYETAAFVSSFVLDARFGLDRGWAVYDDRLAQESEGPDALQRQRGGKSVVDAALAWSARPRAGPVCLWVHFYDPHIPYDVHADEFGDQFHDRAYDAEIAFVDREIQRLLDGLKAGGLADNLLIVVAGDHGEGLGEHVERTHGYTLYDATQRVPLIISCPGKVRAGHTVDASVSLVDVLPSVLGLLEISSPARGSGRSLLPALKGEPIADSICYALTDDPFLQNGWSPLRSIVVDRWKYIRTRQPELYDLKSDPGETKNLFATETVRADSLTRELDRLEQKMVVRAAPTVQLSARESDALKSLGYLGGLTETPAPGDSNDAPDVKEMLVFDVATQDALELLHSGKIDEAVDRLRSIVAESPHHTASRIFLGEALEQQGHADQALAFYRDVLTRKPDHVDARIHMGSALAAMDRTPEALEHFDEALRISPESTSARYNLGLLLSRIGRGEEARQQLEETLRQDDRFPDAHTALAGLLLRQGRREEAMGHFRAEIAQNSRSWEARVNLAALIAESDPESAEQLLVEADTINPENPIVLYNRGAFLLLRKRPREAVSFLERAVDRFRPPNPNAQKELERARRLAAD